MLRKTFLHLYSDIKMDTYGIMILLAVLDVNI